MGGRGSGGRRIGAGRKRKDNVLAFLHGSRQRPGATPEVPVQPAAHVDPPSDITPEHRAVWDLYAPDALKAGTLTTMTARSFVQLVCEPKVVYDRLADTIEKEGLTYVKASKFGDEVKKHPLITDLNNWHRRLDSGLAKFAIAPLGKAVTSSAKPQSRIDAFKASKTGGGE